MSEWWTYRPSSFLLFSPRAYYRLFEIYNAEAWPAQILMLALGTALLVLIHRGQRRIALALLAGCWLVVAWAFLLERYATINWAAEYFAIAFAIEAALLLAVSAFGDSWQRRSHPDIFAYAGLAVAFVGVWAYPALAPLLRGWQHAEFFGLAPDPTAITTLGILLAIRNRIAWGPMVIPILWCLMSGATLWTMDSPEAPLPPLLAVLVLVLMACQRHASRARTPAATS